MKSNLLLFLLVFILPLATFSQARTEDVVYLKNGSIIRNGRKNLAEIEIKQVLFNGDKRQLMPHLFDLSSPKIKLEDVLHQNGLNGSVLKLGSKESKVIIEKNIKLNNSKLKTFN